MARPVHTQFAMKALDLADLFKTLVGGTPVQSTEGPSFRVELSSPDGPSTGGGKQSVQHIKLTRDGLIVVAGSADQGERAVELRTFEYLAHLHAQRYRNAALPIDRADYDAFLKRARDFFKQQELTIILKEAAPVAAAPAPVASASSTPMIVGAVIIVAAVAAAVYVFMMR